MYILYPTRGRKKRGYARSKCRGIYDARTDDDKMADRELKTRYAVNARVNSIRNTTVRFNVYAKTKETRRVNCVLTNSNVLGNGYYYRYKRNHNNYKSTESSFFRVYRRCRIVYNRRSRF